MSIYCIRGHHLDGSLLGPDSVILDLGGHKGEFSGIVTEKWQCRSYVLEAMPELYRGIAETERLKTFHYAAGDIVGTVRFHLSDNPESHSLLQQSSTSAGSIDVPSITVREFMKKHGVEKIDLLKMDIEGAEIAVFDSMDDALLKSVTQITVEFHDFIPELRLEWDVLRIIARMDLLGFHCIVFSLKTHFDVLFINGTAISPLRVSYIRFIKYVHGIQRILNRLLGVKNSD